MKLSHFNFQSKMFRRISDTFVRKGEEIAEKNFFVDTNVIIGFHLREYTGIEEFVRYPGHKFFYTETVLEELQKRNSCLFPETDPESSKYSFFRFINSKIQPIQKQKAIDFFHELWVDRFKNTENKTILGYQLTKEQLAKFRQELLIIIESSFACHAPGVLPNEDFRTPPLLTNNTRLLNKFLIKPRSAAVLEDTINLLGFEHLMPVEFLQDTIEKWENTEKKLKSSLKSTI
ncbi:MAG: hypothetical protein ACHQ1D_03690 [Nitrososphaerales archaeon]